MALDVRRPKGYRKSFDGGRGPESLPDDLIGICTTCGGDILRGQITCRPPCKSPAPFLLPTGGTDGE